MALRVLVVGFLLPILACGREPVAEPTVVRADSAGVRLVTSTAQDRPLDWRLNRVEVLRDSVGEPWLFTRLSPRHVLTDRAGRIYVLENEPAIRRFGRDGRYERSIGRRGGAPGEMQMPIALRQQGDTMAVLDGVRNVLVRWDPAFAPVSDLRLEGALAGISDIAFRFGNVWLLKRDYAAQQQLTRFFLDSTTTEPLFKVEQPIPAMVRGGCRGGGSIAVALPPFFSSEIHFAVAGARLLASVGPSYDVHLYEGARPIARVRRDLPSRAPTAADVAILYPKGLTVATPSTSCAVELDALIKETGMAAQMPFIHGLALLSDGTMWVQRSLREETPPRLDVFGSDGVYAGTLTGYHLPVGRLPNGEVLFPVQDDSPGGLVLARMLIVK